MPSCRSKRGRTGTYGALLLASKSRVQFFFSQDAVFVVGAKNTLENGCGCHEPCHACSLCQVNAEDGTASEGGQGRGAKHGDNTSDDGGEFHSESFVNAAMSKCKARAIAVPQIAADGTLTHFIDSAAGTDYPVYAICDDGTTAYWATRILDAGVDKTVLYKKALTLTSGDAATEMFKTSSIVISKGVMEYVKDRIVLCANNKIFELSTSATSLPTALYTHSDDDVVFTSITASGPAIYIAGYSGIQSFIYNTCFISCVLICST